MAHTPANPQPENPKPARSVTRGFQLANLNLPGPRLPADVWAEILAGPPARRQPETPKAPRGLAALIPFQRSPLAAS